MCDDRDFTGECGEITSMHAESLAEYNAENPTEDKWWEDENKVNEIVADYQKDLEEKGYPDDFDADDYYD